MRQLYLRRGDTLVPLHRLTTRMSSLLMAALTSLATAVEPDTFSPVVSFQYQESLADSETTITSPVVSFQFYEWPGDENLTFQNSPAVSYYFYNGPSLSLTGTVKTGAGAPVPGALVTMKRYGTVFWQATTNGSGTYTTSGLPADNFTVEITKTGYVKSLSNIPGASGGSRLLDFIINPLPAPLPMVDVLRNPAPTAIGQDTPTDPNNTNAPRLKVFNGTQFVDSLTSLNPGKKTIILTHGWKSSPDDWATSLAFQIRTRLGANAVNIVAWDWHIQANKPLPPTDEACTQGVLLGKALLQSPLGSGYDQHLHFIGHSLGTIVNAMACDYLHGNCPRASMNPASPWLASNTKPHITLLDEAEVASIFGQNVTTSAAIGWKAAQLQGALLAGGVAAVANWRNPIPKQAGWVDNYISAVGIRHDEAVNVCLLAPTLALNAQTLQSLKQGMEYAHSYSHLWYNNSVAQSGSFAPVGYSSSLESGAVFPPAGSGQAPGSLWWENIDTPDASDISLIQPNLGGLVDVSFTGDFPILFGLTVVAGSQSGDRFITQPLGSVGNTLISSYQMGIKFAGNIGGTVIYTVGNVISTTTEKIGNWWDAASDKAANVLNNLNPDVTTTDSLAAAVFGIRLKTQTTPQLQIQSSRTLRHSNLNISSAGLPAYAWVSVQVPPDAGMMAFDFTVTGEPVDDKIVCAINDHNVFSLAAKFAPEGEPVSTDMIDVSAYAGQTVELFFGLAGGTSTNCELAIDGVRFITIPQPKLVASMVGDQVRISWPAAATGWVLESSDSLETGSWQEIPMTNSVVVDQGVASMDQPMTGSKKFYRLRRVE